MSIFVGTQSVLVSHTVGSFPNHGQIKFNSQVQLLLKNSDKCIGVTRNDTDMLIYASETATNEQVIIPPRWVRSWILSPQSVAILYYNFYAWRHATLDDIGFITLELLTPDDITKYGYPVDGPLGTNYIGYSADQNASVK